MDVQNKKKKGKPNPSPPPSPDTLALRTEECLVNPPSPPSSLLPPPPPPPELATGLSHFDDLPAEVHTHILSGCGSSLGAASAVARSWRQALDLQSGEAFKPMCYVRARPAPGDASGREQASVAFTRRCAFPSSSYSSSSASSWNWRPLAMAAANPTGARCSWRSVPYAAGSARPSHRHSVAVCGAPVALLGAPAFPIEAGGSGSGDGGHGVLLYGGNISRTVAGHWRTSDELLLLRLPLWPPQSRTEMSADEDQAGGEGRSGNDSGGGERVNHGYAGYVSSDGDDDDSDEDDYDVTIRDDDDDDDDDSGGGGGGGSSGGGSSGGRVSVESLGHGPSSVWGASLVSLRHDGCCYLFGGWSADDGGDTSRVRRVAFREAAVEWSMPLSGVPRIQAAAASSTSSSSSSSSSASSSSLEAGEAPSSVPLFAMPFASVLSAVAPLPVAFHTCTALEDGKRFAVVGGLGGGGSVRGVWIYHADGSSSSSASSRGWELATREGPALAGHAAGVVGTRLAVFGGVERTYDFDSFDGDAFLATTSFFDLRMNRWDRVTTVAGSRSGGGGGGGGGGDQEMEEGADGEEDAADADYSPRASTSTSSSSSSTGRRPLNANSSAPCARRNPSYAVLGRNLVVSGGWDDRNNRTLTDSWALDVTRARWSRFETETGTGNGSRRRDAVLRGPNLEAHKAVISGFDMYTFGGHCAPGMYPDRDMSVNCLSIGL